MSDDLRTRLYDEMAAHDRPPADDLVMGAVSRGARARRRRRFASGAGTTAVVGAVAAVLVLSGQVAPGHSDSVSGAAGSAPTTAAALPAPAAAAVPSAVPTTTQPAPAPTTADLQALVQAQLAKLHADKPGSASAGADKNKLAALGQDGPLKPASAASAGVPATARGMLELLTSLLPEPYSHASVTDDGSLGAKVHVATPTGEAMVVVGLGHAADVPVGCSVLANCTVAANGDIVTVTQLTDKCGDYSVDAIHPDGSEVVVSFGTCLEWDGTGNPRSPLALTVAQAKAIVLDPRWDVSMDPALVSAGAAHFPTPLQFG